LFLLKTETKSRQKCVVSLIGLLSDPSFSFCRHKLVFPVTSIPSALHWKLSSKRMRECTCKHALSLGLASQAAHAGRVSKR